MMNSVMMEIRDKLIAVQVVVNYPYVEMGLLPTMHRFLQLQVRHCISRPVMMEIQKMVMIVQQRVYDLA
jgi:hypothetical protein